MARLIPARPKLAGPVGLALTEALDAKLGDAFVAFQRPPSAVLVVHPDLGLAVVAAPDGVRWNADAERHEKDGVPVRPDDLVAEAVRLFPDFPSGMPSYAGLVAAPGASPAPGLLPLALPDDAFAAIVAEAMSRSSAPLGDEAVSAIVESLSPGAAPYSRSGGVTAVQAEWRSSRKPSGPTGPGKPPAAARAEPSIGVGAPASAASGRLPDLSGIRMLEAVVEQAAGNRPIFATGVVLKPAEVVRADFLLPAMVLAASDAWTPVVARKKGQGGFRVRFRQDPSALTGYRVVDLEPSAPFLLMVPFARIVRDAVLRRPGLGLETEEVNLDAIIEQFARWVSQNGFDDSRMDDIDISIATASVGVT